MKISARSKILLAFVFWLAVFAGIGVLRHRQYLRRLNGYKPGSGLDVDPNRTYAVHPGVTNQQLMLLGWTHTVPHENASWYVLHPTKKAPGKIRIGVFGDSLVEGSEVAKDFDFPTLLQKRFQAAGDRRVEILNFGVGGYGFSQAFLMWEFFAESYELDRAIFLAGPHYLNRDDTFIFQDDSFFSVHARYILRNGRLELLPPLGVSLQNISFLYHGLMPIWRYLRYDARIPVPARMLLSFPTSARFNPFYYAPFGGAERELLPIYGLLLARADAKTPVLVVAEKNFKRKLDAMSVSAAFDALSYSVDLRDDGLMRAPMAHLSAAGNRLRAEELFAYLTGKASVELPYVKLVPLKPAAAPPPRPLYEFSDGTLFLDGIPAGRLTTRKRGVAHQSFYEPSNPRERRIAAFFNAEGADAALVPLSFMPGPSADLVLSFTLDGEVQEAALGRASAPSGIMASLDEGERRWQGVSRRTGNRWTIAAPIGFIKSVGIKATNTKEKFGDATLRLGGREILRGSINAAGRFNFEPTGQEIVHVRQEAGQSFDPFRIGKEGVLTVGKNTPFIGYRVIPALRPQPERPMRAPLAPRNPEGK